MAQNGMHILNNITYLANMTHISLMIVGFVYQNMAQNKDILNNIACFAIMNQTSLTLNKFCLAKYGPKGRYCEKQSLFSYYDPN